MFASVANFVVFASHQEHLVQEKKETKPIMMNAFELISLSRGLNLSGLFEEQPVSIFYFGLPACKHDLRMYDLAFYVLEPLLSH